MSVFDMHLGKLVWMYCCEEQLGVSTSYSSNVHLIDNGPLLSFQGRSLSPSSFQASLLQATDDVMLWHCVHRLSRAPQHFRSSEMQATVMVALPTYLLHGWTGMKGNDGADRWAKQPSQWLASQKT